jgi:cathepsin L
MFKSTLFVVAAASASGMALTEQEQFVQFCEKFQKQYTTEEVPKRFAVFQDNLKKIAEHNAKGESWTMAVTQFADMTAEEFGAMYKGYLPRSNSYARSQNLHVDSGAPLADDIDWTTKGAVTPIKDQAQCGSCWAFSTTGSIEGAHQIATGKLVSVSEQQLVDCAGAEGNQGCNGGLMDDAFEYVIKNGGITEESNYKYTARDGTCKKTVSKDVTISAYKDIKKGSETDLMSALNQQPVSIAVDAGSNWQLYGGGIMKNCFMKRLDHGVLLVGAGTDGSSDYWKVKNSWGSSWGEKGFIRLLRGKDECGLADAASYPTV